jgi:hypothetical protein
VGADGLRPYRVRRGESAERGTATWNFLCILTRLNLNYTRHLDERRAVRTLHDVGLVNVVESRFYSDFSFAWTPQAYLPPRHPRPRIFSGEDERSIEWIGAGLS